jgi:hypothetical protein
MAWYVWLLSPSRMFQGSFNLYQYFMTVLLSCVYMLLAYPLVSWQIFVLFPSFSYCKKCCYENLGTIFMWEAIFFYPGMYLGVELLNYLQFFLYAFTGTTKLQSIGTVPILHSHWNCVKASYFATCHFLLALALFFSMLGI